MRNPPGHPVDALSDDALKELMLRIDATGFPADLHKTWERERLRFRETLRRIPLAGKSDARILDLGHTRPWLPFFQVLLGYRIITLNTAYPDAGFVDPRGVITGTERANVEVSVFDVERDDFPFEDESCDVVTCLEVLEHLAIDPMAMVAEVNRVLKPGGIFVLTTPNAVRYANLINIIMGEQPCGWNPYNGFDTNRHNREYTPREISKLFNAGGFSSQEIITFGRKSRGLMRDWFAAVCRILLAPIRNCPRAWRNDVILAVGRKTSSRIERRPSWLYFDMAERSKIVRNERLQSKARFSRACEVSI